MTARNTMRRAPRYRWADSIEAEVSIRDLSSSARLGFKGADTGRWLEANNIAMPERANQACSFTSQSLNARLSETEFLMIDLESEQNPTLDKLRDCWSMDIEERTYLLERGDSHACFSISGDHTAEVFSKICGVDLRPHKFANLSLAQTSVGRLNSIVIRFDKKEQLRYLLLADISAAEYLWNVVVDAADEFNQPRQTNI